METEVVHEICKMTILNIVSMQQLKGLEPLSEDDVIEKACRKLKTTFPASYNFDETLDDIMPNVFMKMIVGGHIFISKVNSSHVLVRTYDNLRKDEELYEKIFNKDQLTQEVIKKL